MGLEYSRNIQKIHESAIDWDNFFINRFKPFQVIFISIGWPHGYIVLFSIYSRDQIISTETISMVKLYTLSLVNSLLHCIDKLAPERDNRLATIHSKRIQTVDINS
jgi:hypothetical protein